MNVLVVSREVPPVGGGAGYVALHLARELAARYGHTVHIVTMGCGDLPPYECQAGVHIYRIPCWRRHRESSYLPEMILFLLRAVPFCRKLIRQQKIQLVHAHAIIPDGLVAIAAARGQVPVIATAHGTDVPGYNAGRFKMVHKLVHPAWLSVVRKLAGLVAPSQYLAGLIRHVAPDASPDIIHYGIDDTIFPEQELRDKGDDFLIVSRLEWRKNFQLFFAAIKDVSARMRVHVVGEGEMLETIKGLAGEMPQHEIVFHGWLANGSPEWRALYQQSRYFVFPSASENYPVCLMEAMLAKLVILASDISGNREVLGDCAVFYEPNSVSSIREAVAGILQASMGDSGAIAESSRRRVVACSSWKVVCGQYDDLYRRVVWEREVG